MNRFALGLCAVLALAPPAAAQELRDQINELFIFGSGEDQLFLAGTADPNNPTGIQAHGSHFVPSAVSSNGSLITFLTSALGSNIANIPISATSSGTTFRFKAGVPVPTSTSSGPIFAERAQTLGRGRVLIGVSVSQFNFKSLRGVDLNAIRLNFTHQNTDFPGCDSIFGGDCSDQGLPTFENDFIQMDLDLNIDVRAVSFVMTYGLLDRVDIGVALPIITTSLRGRSEAQVVPFTESQAAHFFDGTFTDPDLFASRFVEGSATGIGDLAVRAKVAVSDAQRAKFAILADARFATGSEEDFLGSGDFALRGVGILSAQFGAFSPHANLGYLYRAGSLTNDAVLATVGFDQLMAPWATLAVDLVSELQVGTNRLKLPGEVVIQQPFRRTIQPSTIPNTRDDIVNASLGFKFLTSAGVSIITNAIWPLNRAGLRPNVVWTAALEYGF
ncbi:MAG: hypothetical protein HKM89_09465 [Gemmatimonadales bacterium]|nr:hypothetical protein [Gemmatimonadales bacterium]